MDDLNKHKIDFADGFKDGYKRSESGKFCRWVEHIDVTDGFKTPNPVYTLALSLIHIRRCRRRLRCRSRWSPYH